jgi:3-methylcrotonyl-CoA carboxylase alpha subunit
MDLRFRSQDTTRVVRIERTGDRYRVDLEGRFLDVEVLGSNGPALDVRIDARTISAIVVADGDRRIVKIGAADPVTVRLVRAGRAEGGARRAADGRVTAVMDGEVVAVLAGEGERVEAGAPLVVLEAMKMEMRLTAPVAGRVAKIACAPGQVVERGVVLVEIEPEPVPAQEL